MLRAVHQLNKGEAQRQLNELLGYLVFSSGGELARIKTQIYELLVLASRAAINSLQNFNALCLWFTKTMGALMDSVLDLAGVRHANMTHQTVQYLNTHYAERITLEQMAQRVYLSPLSRLRRRAGCPLLSGRTSPVSQVPRPLAAPAR